MRCGQHRRCERAARRRHTSGVQRGVCALDVGDLLARVHLRARQPTRRGGPRASGGARDSGYRCCPGQKNASSSTSTRCCARSTATTNRAPRSGTPRSPAARCCVWASHRRSPPSPQRRPRRSSPRRGCAAGGPAPGAPPRPRSSRPSAPPAPAGPAGTILVRGDSAFGTKKVITTCVSRRRRVLPVGEPQQAHQRRDRGHRRGRLHPGALSRAR